VLHLYVISSFTLSSKPTIALLITGYHKRIHPYYLCLGS
jgi:hypothetical protein